MINETSNLSRGLGVLGVALGVPELFAPSWLARTIGIHPDRRSTRLLRILGARELLASAAIFLRPDRSLPLWARVAGDVLDIALLGTAAITRRRSTPRVAVALAAVAGAGVIDLLAARRAQRAARLSVDGESDVTIIIETTPVTDVEDEIQTIP